MVSWAPACCSATHSGQRSRRARRPPPSEALARLRHPLRNLRARDDSRRETGAISLHFPRDQTRLLVAETGRNGYPLRPTTRAVRALRLGHSNRAEAATAATPIEPRRSSRGAPGKFRLV